MQINSTILNEFEEITGYPLLKYFESFVQFMSNDYQTIVDFYSGNFSQTASTSFDNLILMQKETSKLFNIITLNKKRLNNYKWWDVIEQIEQIDTTLLTTSVLSKWLRSTITNTSYNPNPEVEVPFKQGSTLESISRTVIGEDDWNDKWTDIAFKNDLEEEKYTSEGGGMLKINYNNPGRLFQINSIVDNPVDERILGLDLLKRLTFDVDAQDLTVLTPKETFYQTIDIYINLRKNDNPEFPEDGIDKDVAVGSNINSIAYPILFRQATDVFKKDDTIKDFKFTGVDRKQDALFLEFTVSTRLGELEKVFLKV